MASVFFCRVMYIWVISIVNWGLNLGHSSLTGNIVLPQALVFCANGLIQLAIGKSVGCI